MKPKREPATPTCTQACLNGWRSCVSRPVGPKP